jgi:hypothetical protein
MCFLILPAQANRLPAYNGFCCTVSPREGRSQGMKRETGARVRMHGRAMPVLPPQR